MYEKLVKLGGENPKIEAWFLTHPHPDHIEAIMELFHRNKSMKIQTIYRDFLDYDFYMETHGPDAYELDEGVLKEFEEFESTHKELLKTPQPGQEIVVGSVKIKILHTPSQKREFNNRFNNSSIVFRMDIEEQRVLFVGDLAEEGGEQVLAKVSAEDLRADYMQMAHHGQNGVNRRFYEIVSPKVCMWHTPIWLWNNDIGEGYGTGPFHTLEVRKWMEELGVRENYVSYTGEHMITF